MSTARFNPTTILVTLIAASTVARAAPAKYVPSPDELHRAYERAAALPNLVRGRVFKATVIPHWFADGSRFWYRNELRGGASEFITVDAVRGRREPAFDHAKLAVALSKAAGAEYKADRLPFDRIEFTNDAKAVRFKVGDTVWQCDLATYECVKSMGTVAPAASAPGGFGRPPQFGGGQNAASSVRSPDGKWTAFVKDHNLFLRNGNGKETQLTREGAAGKYYGAMSWSPDSKTLAAHRIEPGERKEVAFVQSSPSEGGRAKLHTRPYALPGDKFAAYEPWLFDVESALATKAQVDVIDFGFPRLRWKSDGSSFSYEKVDRGHQRFRVVEVDARTGVARNLIDEKSATFIWTAHTETLGVPRVTWLAQTDEIIYASERDGWRHLYLLDAQTGAIKNPITTGQWVVRGVERIDEENRQVWFRACGVNTAEDPYFIHYYRVNFDGTGLVALTAGNGNHTVQYSPERKFIVDTYSRVDAAPRHDLRNASDGKLVCELEQAEIAALTATGWKAPEVFAAKGRDGVTDIWGVVFRPTNLDPSKQYPIIENIYAGPHGSFVPKSFSVASGMQSLAELGFIVVQCDGMGTANRSKAFHDVCWQNLGDAGFPDRILWIKALAAKYPYMDVNRVGIYGTSAGGQSSTGALLFHPEFYKVAVSSCGCHDNRMDKASWNEQWMGYPVGPQYAASSNITNASKLRGKLLLMVGEMDTNVPPESTLRLADALIKAGKDFDLIVLPGMDHTNGGAYGERRRRDFFVRHLHGVEPPDRNATAGN